MTVIPGASQAATFRKRQGVAGVSPGGVILPGVEGAPEIAESFIIGPPGPTSINLEVPRYFPEGGTPPQKPFLNPPSSLGIPNPADDLIASEGYYKAKPPPSYVSWFPTDKEWTPEKKMTERSLFVIPLVAYHADLIALAYKFSSSPETMPVAWLPRSVFAPEIHIGFAPAEPTVAAAETDQEREGANYLNFESPRLRFSSGVTGDPFAGGVSYRLPVGWVESPYHTGYLAVGTGNYNPSLKAVSHAFGTTLAPYSLEVREYEEMLSKMSPAELAAHESAEKTTEELLDKLMHDELTRFLEMGEVWQKLIIADRVRHEWLVAHEPTIELLSKELGEPGKSKAEYEAIEAALHTLEVEANVLEKAEQAIGEVWFGLSVGFSGLLNFPEIGNYNRVGMDPDRDEIQAKHGPYRNGVKKWAYRFKWNDPPGGLPDLSKTKGFFVIEIRASPGTRWTYSSPTTRYPVSPAFEVQEPGKRVGTPGTITPGATLTGRIRS